MASSQQLQRIDTFNGMYQGNGDEATPKNFSYCWDMRNCTLLNGAVERAKTPQLKSLTGAILTGLRFTGEWSGNFLGAVINIIGFGKSIYRKKNLVLSPVYTMLSDDEDLHFAVYQNKIIICNGLDVPMQYDGVTCEAISFNDPDSIWNDARPFKSFVWGNDLFYVTKDKLYKPQPLTNNNFDNTNNTCEAINIYTGRGGWIQAVEPFTADLLPIYTDRSILRLAGSQPSASSVVDPFIVRPLAPGVGCIAPKTVVTAGIDQYFLTEKGLQTLQAIQAYGDARASNLFEAIKQDFRTLRLKSNINKAFSVYDEYLDKIYIFIRGYGNTTIRYGIDVLTGDIEKYILPYVATNAYYIEDNESVYIGTDTGTYYEIQQTSFDTSESYYETMYYPSKYGKNILKKWDRLVIGLETDTSLANLKIQHKHLKDESFQASFTEESSSIESGDLWDAAEWDTEYFDRIGGGLVTIKNLGKSKAIKLRFYNNTSGEHFRINSLELLYTPLGARK